MNTRLRGDHRLKLITACEGRKQPVYPTQLQVMWRNVMNNNWVGEWAGWELQRLHHLMAAALAGAPHWPQCCQMTVHESRMFWFYFYNLAGSDMSTVFIYVNGLNIEHLHSVWKDQQVNVYVRFWGPILIFKISSSSRATFDNFIRRWEHFWMLYIFRWLWLSICLSSWHLESIVLLQQEGHRERVQYRALLLPHKLAFCSSNPSISDLFLHALLLVSHGEADRAVHERNG